MIVVEVVVRIGMLKRRRRRRRRAVS